MNRGCICSNCRKIDREWCKPRVVQMRMSHGDGAWAVRVPQSDAVLLKGAQVKVHCR